MARRRVRGPVVTPQGVRPAMPRGPIPAGVRTQADVYRNDQTSAFGGRVQAVGGNRGASKS